MQCLAWMQGLEDLEGLESLQAWCLCKSGTNPATITPRQPLAAVELGETGIEPAPTPELDIRVSSSCALVRSLLLHSETPPPRQVQVASDRKGRLDPVFGRCRPSQQRGARSLRRPASIRKPPRRPPLQLCADNTASPRRTAMGSSMPSQSTNAGIVTDENSGERQIPESVRADGSTRKAIKIRPGYRPPEDVEVYKNRTAEAFRERGKRIGIPGAVGVEDEAPEQGAAANKNAKRREARKKAKAAAEGESAAEPPQPPKPEEADPNVERDKKARNLRKKLKQARDLESKKEGGETLLPEQIAKVIKIKELIRELDALGIDAEGE